jgi:hypothetical protein
MKRIYLLQGNYNTLIQKKGERRMSNDEYRMSNVEVKDERKMTTADTRQCLYSLLNSTFDIRYSTFSFKVSYMLYLKLICCK